MSVPASGPATDSLSRLHPKESFRQPIKTIIATMAIAISPVMSLRAADAPVSLAVPSPRIPKEALDNLVKSNWHDKISDGSFSGVWKDGG